MRTLKTLVVALLVVSGCRTSNEEKCLVLAKAITHAEVECTGMSYDFIFELTMSSLVKTDPPGNADDCKKVKYIGENYDSCLRLVRVASCRTINPGEASAYRDFDLHTFEKNGCYNVLGTAER